MKLVISSLARKGFSVSERAAMPLRTLRSFLDAALTFSLSLRTSCQCLISRALSWARALLCSVGIDDIGIGVFGVRNVALDDKLHISQLMPNGRNRNPQN